MRYATPTRSAHRATPSGALTLLVRPPGPAGQHRYHPWPHTRLSIHPGPAGQHRYRTGPRTRPQRHARRDPHEAAHLLTRGLAALIVLGIVVMMAVLIVADERRAPAPADPATAEIDQRLASRETDPAPLSETEVFPTGSAAYRTARSAVTADCALAATGALRFTLRRYGCSQAVRAALTVPYADYKVTAGVLNLDDAPGAAAAGAQVHTLVETGDGGFTSLDGTETTPGTPVGWRTRGHYLMYCVITGPGGEPLPAADSQVRRITTELLDTHLSETVLSRRAT